MLRSVEAFSYYNENDGKWFRGQSGDGHALLAILLAFHRVLK